MPAQYYQTLAEMYAAERDEPGGAPSGTDYGKKPLSAVARKMLALDPQGAPPPA